MTGHLRPRPVRSGPDEGRSGDEFRTFCARDGALLLWPGYSRAGPPDPNATNTPTREGVSHRMSSIVYDYLLPILGPEQAAHWAQILVINPAG